MLLLQKARQTFLRLIVRRDSGRGLRGISACHTT